MTTSMKQELETVFTANLKPLQSGFVSATTQAAGFSGAMKTAFSGISSFAKNTINNMKTLGLALVGATGYATKMYAEFEKGMSNVWTLTDWTKEQWQDTGKDVLNIAKASGEELTTLTKGLYDTISAQPNISRKDATAFLEMASKSAVAGATNTAISVDALTSVVNSYDDMLGKNLSKTQKAEKASDILFNTIKYGKTTYQELAGSIGRVSAVGALSGVSLGELGAALATATLGGLKTDEAVTSLRQILVSALNPTKEASDEAKKLGIEFSATAIKSQGLYNWLKSIQNAVEQTESPTESLTKLFGNVRAFSGAAIIMKMKGMYQQLNKAIISETGTTAKAYTKMSDTFSFKWNQAMASMKVTAIELGRGAVDALKPLWDSNQEGIETTKAFFSAYDIGKTVISGVAASFYFLKAVILQIIGYSFDFKSTWTKTLGWFELTATKGFERIFGIMWDKIKGTPLQDTALGKSIFSTYWNWVEQSYASEKAYKNLDKDFNEGSKVAFSQALEAANMAKAYGFQALETMGLKDKSETLGLRSTDEDLQQEVIKRLQGKKIGKIQGKFREYDFSSQPFFTPKPKEGSISFSGGPVNTERQKQIDAMLMQVLKETGRTQEFEQKKTNFLLEKLLEKMSQSVQIQEKQPAKEKKFFIAVDGKTVISK